MVPGSGFVVSAVAVAAVLAALVWPVLTQERMCPELHHLEQYVGDPNHGNVCRSDVADNAFVCPRCCTVTNGPPHCGNTAVAAAPCRATDLSACTAAIADKQPGPKTMHTFFEVVSSWTEKERQANQNLLAVWECVWGRAGWKTRIITLADAKAHPDFKDLSRILDTIPLGTNKMYDKICYLRHLAMAAVGGGWMSDYDTIPLHIQSGMPLPNNGRWTSQEWSVPSLVSGNKSEWHRMAFMLANTGTKHKDEQLFSDMMAMQELATQKPPPYTLEQNVLGLSQTFGSELWGPKPCELSKNKWAAHLSHYAFVTAKKNQLDRAKVIAETCDEWRNKCTHEHDTLAAPHISLAQKCSTDHVTDASLYATDKWMQISRTNRLIFVHIPKTAGSLIEKSQLFADARKNHAIGGHWHVTEMKADLASRKLDGFTTFALVRHPCERYISAFTYLKNGLGNVDDAKWTRENIGDYDVNEFAHQLGRTKHNLAKHFELQSSQIFYVNGTVGIDLLLVYQSNISQTMSPLASVRPDLTPLLPNVTSKQVLGSNHGKCASLTASARRALEQFYTFDYCVFGFAKFADARAVPTPSALTMQDLTARWTRCSRTLG